MRKVDVTRTRIHSLSSFDNIAAMAIPEHLHLERYSWHLLTSHRTASMVMRHINFSQCAQFSERLYNPGAYHHLLASANNT